MAPLSRRLEPRGATMRLCRQLAALAVTLLLAGPARRPAEARTLNESCAAPETSVLRPAPPQHVSSRLRPPTTEEAACAALELQAEQEDPCSLVVLPLVTGGGDNGTAAAAAARAPSPWESCGGGCAARGGCWQDMADPCASIVPTGQFRTVGGVCVRHRSFAGSCVAPDGCLHLSPRGMWETCDGRCVPRGGCWDFADPCQSLGPGHWDSVEGVCVPRIDCGVATDECEHLTPVSALGFGRADTAHFELCNGLCVPRGGCGPSLPTVDATVTVQESVADSEALLRELRRAHGDGAMLLAFDQTVSLSLDVPLRPDKFDNTTAEGRAVRWSFKSSLRSVLSDAVRSIALSDDVEEAEDGRRRMEQAARRVLATSDVDVTIESAADLAAELASPTFTSDVATGFGAEPLPASLADDPELSRFWSLPTIAAVDLEMTGVAYETVLQVEVEVEDDSTVAETVSRLQDVGMMTSVLSAAGVSVDSSTLSITGAGVSACARHTLLWSRTICTGSLGDECAYTCLPGYVPSYPHVCGSDGLFSGGACEVAPNSCLEHVARLARIGQPVDASGLYSISDLTGQEVQLRVQCDMESDGGGWTRVGRQLYPNSFTSKAQQQSNARSPTASLYLILDRLEQFRGSKGWEFRLVWPHLRAEYGWMYVRAGSKNAIQWAQDWWGDAVGDNNNTKNCYTAVDVPFGSNAGFWGLTAVGSSDASIALSISEEGFFAFGYIDDMTVSTCTGTDDGTRIPARCDGAADSAGAACALNADATGCEDDSGDCEFVAAVQGTAETCEMDPCAGYVQGSSGIPSTTCPSGCTLAGDGSTETCTPTVADCSTGYIPGDAATPSSTCPTGCVFTAATSGVCVLNAASTACAVDGGNCAFAGPKGGIPGPRLETADYFEDSFISEVELYVRAYDDEAACTVVPEPEPEPEPEPPTREPLSAFGASQAGALSGFHLENNFVQVEDASECAARCLQAGADCESFDFSGMRSRCYLNNDMLGNSSGVHEGGCEAGDCTFVYYPRDVTEPSCYLNETTGCCLEDGGCPSDCGTDPWPWDDGTEFEMTLETCVANPCEGYVQGTTGVPSTTCPDGCTLAGDGPSETCTPTQPNCANGGSTGYVRGDALNPSTTCPTGCIFTPSVVTNCACKGCSFLYPEEYYIPPEPEPEPEYIIPIQPCTFCINEEVIIQAGSPVPLSKLDERGVVITYYGCNEENVQEWMDAKSAVGYVEKYRCQWALGFFTCPIEGALQNRNLDRMTGVWTAELCAQACLRLSSCVSFDYSPSGKICLLGDTKVGVNGGIYTYSQTWNYYEVISDDVVPGLTPLSAADACTPGCAFPEAENFEPVAYTDDGTCRGCAGEFWNSGSGHLGTPADPFTACDEVPGFVQCEEPGTCSTTAVSGCASLNMNQGMCEESGECIFTLGSGDEPNVCGTREVAECTAANERAQQEGTLNTCTTTTIDACAGANGDESTCTSAGACSFAPATDADAATCATTVVPECETANTDEETCIAAGPCTFTSAETTCTAAGSCTYTGGNTVCIPADEWHYSNTKDSCRDNFNASLCLPWTECDDTDVAISIWDATEYETVAPTSMSDRVCTNLTVCSASQYQSVAPTPTSDRECAAATVCNSLQYANPQLTLTADRVCHWVRSCTDLEWEAFPPTETQDRSCVPIKDCNVTTEFQTAAPTTTSDRVCQLSRVCTEYEYEIQAPTTLTDRICTNLTVCGPHGVEVVAPGQTTDRRCVCDSESFYSLTDTRLLAKLVTVDLLYPQTSAQIRMSALPANDSVDCSPLGLGAALVGCGNSCAIAGCVERAEGSRLEDYWVAHDALVGAFQGVSGKWTDADVEAETVCDHVPGLILCGEICIPRQQCHVDRRGQAALELFDEYFGFYNRSWSYFREFLDPRFHFMPQQCIPLTKCTSCEWESVEPEPTSDRTCNTTTMCTLDEFESVAPTRRSDRVCTNITTCAGEVQNSSRWGRFIYGVRSEQVSYAEWTRIPEPEPEPEPDPIVDMVTPSLVLISNVTSGEGIAGFSTYQLLLKPTRWARNFDTIAGEPGRPMIMPPSFQMPEPLGTNIAGPYTSLINFQPDTAYDSWLTISLTEGDREEQLLATGSLNDTESGDAPFVLWSEDVQPLLDPDTGEPSGRLGGELYTEDGALIWANASTAPTDETVVAQVRKRHFLRHLYIKCIILPRQARDKHRENSKKGRFLAVHDAGGRDVFDCLGCSWRGLSRRELGSIRSFGSRREATS
jgi:hypothetical protein